MLPIKDNRRFLRICKRCEGRFRPTSKENWICDPCQLKGRIKRRDERKARKRI